MSSFRFEKITGGATVQKDSDTIQGVHPHVMSCVDVENSDLVTVTVRGWQNRISVGKDTVVIDETGIGGGTHTYEPGTLTSRQLQAAIMNCFNPYSNFITP